MLLVEDDALVRMTTADLLADLGHEVLQADTAQAGLRALAGGADILLVDFGLPDMDGRAFAALARQRQPGIPIVIASGRNDANAESQIDALPGTPPVWLMKPYNEHSLAVALERACAIVE